MSNYDPHKIYDIGFIGAGNMAQAIGLALVKSGKFFFFFLCNVQLEVPVS